MHMTTELPAMRPMYNAVDGVRSIAHISLIALHSAMLLTGKLPSEGNLWDAFKSCFPFTAFQAGGIQVDTFFMLSGFLLVVGLANRPYLKMPSVIMYAFRRALRMLPMMVVCIMLGHYVMVDCWGPPYTYMDGGKDIFPDRVMTLLLFYTNYCDQVVVGSFLGSLMWSCAVDLHVGVFIVIVIKLVVSVTKERNTRLLALKWIFGALVLIACVIRASIFDKDSINMIMLGQYSHFGLLQPQSSYTWMMDFFGHEWQTSNSAVQTTHAYLNNMYFPTHTRFGPFAVGGYLACCILQAEEKYNGKNIAETLATSNFISRTLSTLLCWTFTVVAVMQLVVPCLPAPPPDEMPLAAQLFVTAALRNISAMSAAFLLFRCLVPHKHPWYFRTLDSFLSLPVWKAVASISFCSYLIHFRLIMELTYSSKWRNFFGIIIPAIIPVLEGQSYDALLLEWVWVMLKIFVVGLCISFTAAKILHEVVEKPVATFLSRFVFAETREPETSSGKKAN